MAQVKEQFDTSQTHACCVHRNLAKLHKKSPYWKHCESCCPPPLPPKKFLKHPQDFYFLSKSYFAFLDCLINT